jgi:hypothetical protein
MQLCFNSCYYFIQIIRYMFRSYYHPQVEIYTSKINMTETPEPDLIHATGWKLPSLRGLGKFKISPHRVSNPRPSGL